MHAIGWLSRRLLIILNHFLNSSCKKSYVPVLIKDIQSWKQNHIHPLSLLSFFSRGKGKSDSKGYHNYIQWLDYTGKLDNYLDRSISYIYMRDLGKALDSPDTQTRVRRTVDSLKNHLTHSTEQTVETNWRRLAWLGCTGWPRRKALNPP